MRPVSSGRVHRRRDADRGYRRTAAGSAGAAAAAEAAALALGSSACNRRFRARARRGEREIPAPTTCKEESS
jgi:hypothetical protein